LETELEAERSTHGSNGDGDMRPPVRLLEMFEGRSTRPTTCPFLRSEADDALRPPIEKADDANRCSALDEPDIPSHRQQELVCLTSGHINCPRYLRGALVARQLALSMPRRRTLTGAIFGSILVLIASTAASFAFVVTRGGLDMPLASPLPSLVAAAPTSSPPPPPTLVPTTVVAVGPSPIPSIEPTPIATPEPTATPTPEPTATPRPQPQPTAKPTSDRFAVIDPCPDRPNCYIYTIRAGDNLFSIAHWFGVPIDSIYRMNPWTRTRGIHAGDKLLIPTPTR
jgi:LysM domain